MYRLCLASSKKIAFDRDMEQGRFIYQKELQREYASRKASNQSYSVRAFARYLGVSNTALSEVLAAKRDFSLQNAQKVAAKLNWSPQSVVQMLAQIQGNSRNSETVSEVLQLAEDEFQFVSEWYHLAILNLAKLPQQQAEPHWIAAHLGISEKQAKDSLERMLRLGFIRIHEKKIVRVAKSLRTSLDIPSQAIRRYHQQNLLLAENALENVDVMEREISSMTMAIAKKDLKKAKEMIVRFKRRFAKQMETEDPEEVYSLAMHFFPATIRKQESNE